jgi:Tfp pilus assembly protein PilF
MENIFGIGVTRTALVPDGYAGGGDTGQPEPSNAVDYFNRGNAYLSKKDYGRAIADYDEALRLNPNYAASYFNRGVAYFSKKDYDRAIADYDEALRLNPNYATAYFNRGVAYFSKKDYDRAITDYGEAIRINPNDATAYNNRGDAYKNKEEYDRSIVDYSEALRLNPNYAAAYFDRGFASYKKKDYDKAIADWEKVVQIDPNNADARKNIEVLRDIKRDAKNPVVAFGKLMLKSNLISLCVLAIILAVGYFFIDAFTPDVTEINTAESLAIENVARFYVSDSLKVRDMDGRSVEWKPKFTANAILVLLSPGTHTFTLDFETSDGDIKWSAKDLKIATDFQTGKYYRFNYSLDKETRKISYAIKETDPVVYKSGKFDPGYGSLAIGAIAFVILVILVIIARKKGRVFNITSG